MNKFSQGNIIKINSFPKKLFIIVSNNAFIRATGMFHVCPMLPDIPAGPVHIVAKGNADTEGTAICEQIKAVDPKARACIKVDSLPYDKIMDISDAVQGIFEYD